MKNSNDSNHSAIKHVPVLIVGGGISGLTMTLFLLKQGITPLLIERHKTTSIHPRARGFDIRTMELYRELQIAGKIREAGKALAPAWGIHSGDSLASVLKKIKPKKKKSPATMKSLDALFSQSPETGARCTQDLSEPVLLDTAKRRGGDLRFNTELMTFEQNEHVVTAVIRDRETGREELIHADYMIAADGANSMIRKELHADITGKGALGNLLNIYFEADLRQYVKGREFSLLRIEQGEIKGLLTSINNSDRWVFHLHYEASRGEKADDYTEERILPILENVIGLPEMKIRVLSILPWQPTVKAAVQMQHGRVFLVGDAAHVMTPYGGKGANSGIQDVHNLAWKMAAVIKKQASPVLLNTYTPERQPIGQHYAEQSGKMANEYGLLKKMNWRFYGAFIFTMLIHFLRLGKLFPRVAMRRLGILFGLPEYKYTSAAIMDGASQNRKYEHAGLLNGRPGTRFPHVWVEQHRQKISTLDLFGNEFLLVTGTENIEWRKASDALHRSMKLELPVYSIGNKADLNYREKKIKNVLGINDQGCVLVRPDGIVAWRSRQQHSNASEALENVMRSILSAN